jgi:protein required for attachment to host cells
VYYGHVGCSLFPRMKRACIAIVDAAHARLYSYEQRDEGEPTLTEERDLVNAGRQAHGMFSDKPSRAPGGDGKAAKDDHRFDHLAEREQRFARMVVAEIDRLVRDRDFRHVILVASPRMLGALRRSDAQLRRPEIVLDQIPQDLSWLSSPQVHDHLAAMKLIDPRQRLPSPRSR